MNSELEVDYATCSTCKNLEVSELLTKFSIEIPLHTNFSTGSYHSFIKTFEKILSVEEAQLVTIITTRSNDRSFKSLKTLEYGTNMSDIQVENNFVFNLAFIAAMANDFDREILVFCDPFCLNFVHKGRQVISVMPDREFTTILPLACVLSGMNIYHPLLQSNSLRTHVMTARRSTVYYRNLELPRPPRRNLRIPDVPDITFIENNDSGRRELNIDEVGYIPGEEQEFNEIFGNGNEHSTTLNEFLASYFPNSRSEEIPIESYTTPVCLDLLRSQQVRMPTQYKKTFDTDGFFSHFLINDYPSVIISPVKFQLFPTVVDARTQNTIKRVLLNEGFEIMQSSKIGSIDFPLGTIEIIIVLCSNENDRLPPDMFPAVVQNCANFARLLPCESDQNHMENNCNSKEVRASHISTRRAGTSTHRRNESEQYTAAVASCYIYHFAQKLIQELRRCNSSGESKIFLKGIGMKSTTYTGCPVKCLEIVKSFGEIVDFSRLGLNNVYIDFCITSSLHSPVFPVIN